jgi:hypothetical protein
MDAWDPCADSEASPLPWGGESDAGWATPEVRFLKLVRENNRCSGSLALKGALCARTDEMEPNQVNVLALTVLRDLEQINETEET